MRPGKQPTDPISHQMARLSGAEGLDRRTIQQLFRRQSGETPGVSSPKSGGTEGLPSHRCVNKKENQRYPGIRNQQLEPARWCTLSPTSAATLQHSCWTKPTRLVPTQMPVLARRTPRLSQLRKARAGPGSQVRDNERRALRAREKPPTGRPTMTPETPRVPDERSKQTYGTSRPGRSMKQQRNKRVQKDRPKGVATAWYTLRAIGLNQASSYLHAGSSLRPTSPLCPVADAQWPGRGAAQHHEWTQENDSKTTHRPSLRAQSYRRRWEFSEGRNSTPVTGRDAGEEECIQ